jgi:hypothetical protein
LPAGKRDAYLTTVMMFEEDFKAVFSQLELNVYCFKQPGVLVWDETIHEPFSIDTFEGVLGTEKDGLFVASGMEQPSI